MARPLVTVEGRIMPTGANGRRIQRDAPGLRFTRIPGVRRLRQFPSAQRLNLPLQTQEELFEERYQEWFRTWRGTRPEFIVFDYLEKRRGFSVGSDFLFQSSQAGGRQRVGGAVVDFEFPLFRLYFRVQGERFHLSPDSIAHDNVQRVMLSSFGWTVIDIWVDQLLAAPERVIEAALQGRQLRTARE